MRFAIVVLYVSALLAIPEPALSQGYFNLHNIVKGQSRPL